MGDLLLYFVKLYKNLFFVFQVLWVVGGGVDRPLRPLWIRHFSNQWGSARLSSAGNDALLYWATSIVLFPPQPCWERLVFITNAISESSQQCRRFLISPSQTKSLLIIEYRLPIRLVHKYEYYYSTTVCHRCRETLAALPVISGFIWLFPVTPAIAVNTVAVNKAIALDNVSEVVTFIFKNSLFREQTRARMTCFYGVCLVTS